MNLLQFIKNMIYFNKLIDICINRQESQEVVNNYDNGSNLNKFRWLFLKMIGDMIYDLYID